MLNQQRIAIIGAGHVGATAAYAIMLRALFREIVLIDRDTALAQAEATDISDANALARPTRIWAGDYRDAAAAQIAVITAGAATHGNETRLSVATRSATVVEDCVAALMGGGFDGILLVAANPVDLMTQLAFEKSGLSPARVIGTGTLLDSCRLKQAVAEHLDVAPGAVEALVIGEHGDSEVTAFSSIRIGGVTLDRFVIGQALDYPAVANEVRTAGYRIIGGKGFTSFGIATAIVRICEAIIRDEGSTFPVSTLMTGQFGLTDVCLSLPCILGAGGVERVLMPDLDPLELAGLKASASAIQSAYAGLRA
ncbi:L-lactate dehydrogenase [Sphingomonas sp.]|uniref:L-lactate dehydrogenase n=1 Tax=Sphingomonas sp. TaxID=28214 RepID=UPI0025D7B150|nr:L-lactate dehydrogenase [Sphingomonas sp.]